MHTSHLRNALIKNYFRDLHFARYFFVFYSSVQASHVSSDVVCLCPTDVLLHRGAVKLEHLKIVGGKPGVYSDYICSL